jgi:hypothetical protein
MVIKSIIKLLKGDHASPPELPGTYYETEENQKRTQQLHDTKT